MTVVVVGCGVGVVLPVDRYDVPDGTVRQRINMWMKHVDIMKLQHTRFR